MNLRSQLRRAKSGLGASLLIFVAAACDEEGKTAPETCLDPPLEIYDIQNPPAEGGAGSTNPCVTPVGHAVSPSAGTETGGSSTGGTTAAGGDDSGGAGAGGA